MKAAPSFPQNGFQYMQKDATGKGRLHACSRIHFTGPHDGAFRLDANTGSAVDESYGCERPGPGSIGLVDEPSLGVLKPANLARTQKPRV